MKTFALKMGHSGSSPKDREIMYFVHRHRGLVSDLFRTKYARKAGSSHSDYVDEEEDMEEGPRPVVGLLQPMTAGDKVRQYLAHLATDKGQELEAADSDAVSEADDMEESAELPDMATYEDCIVHSAAYEWLRQALLATIVRMDASPDVRKEIREQVIRSLVATERDRTLSRSKGAKVYRVQAAMDWDPRAFARSRNMRETGATPSPRQSP
ncbi:hypothetical protein GE09DRAFT_691073 [Coniochaeta sp. 2T2.1]|nr:hypothetical protein GE09DRAFT_691073 [Coniochaeta sp. 2T2.1]